MPPLVAIRPESTADYEAIGEVTCQAFGQDDEARLVERLRDGGHVLLSLVAVDADDEIAAHILFSRLQIITTNASIDAVALAPMAVLPAHQRQGVGSRLVEEGLALCRKADEQIVVVLGHPNYYPRFGFSSDLAAPLAPPFEVPREAWMALELVPGALAGVQGRVEYPPPFAAVE